MERRSLFTYVISHLSKISERIEGWLTSLILDVRFGPVDLRPGDLVRHRHHSREISLVIDVRPRRRASTLDVLILVGGETFWVMSSLLVRIDTSRDA